MQHALIVIDIQNDYFPDGKYPQWNPDEALNNILSAINMAKEKNIPVMLVQHVAEQASPFFNPGSDGVLLHSDVLAAAKDAPVIVKQHADSFLNTSLQSELSKRQITELIVCGIMTQNCVTHTALSESASAYNVSVLSDCCTSVDAMVHAIALRALSDRVSVVSKEEAF